jgi:hypothetical protein
MRVRLPPVPGPPPVSQEGVPSPSVSPQVLPEGQTTSIAAEQVLDSVVSLTVMLAVLVLGGPLNGVELEIVF